MINISWSSTMLILLLVAVLPVHVWTYKILIVPVPGKSHVFSMAAMAEGLVNRGHEVTLFIGESFPLNLPELSNRTEISVVRYKDSTDGVHVEYDAVLENVTKYAIESGGDVKNLAPKISKMYVTTFIAYLQGGA